MDETQEPCGEGSRPGTGRTRSDVRSEMLNPKEDNMVQGLGMEVGAREHGECVQRLKVYFG